MAGILRQRVTEILCREAESVSDAPPLLAEIKFTAKSANNRRLFAKFNSNGDWERIDDGGDDLAARSVDQIRLIVPGPYRTNCWETAFYLVGLTDEEGGTTHESLDAFLQEHVRAGKLKLVDSLSKADLVTNGSADFPEFVVHAAVKVDFELVRESLEIAAHFKKLCATQLGLSIPDESATESAGQVLIERFGASMTDDVSARYANGAPLNFAIDLGELRENATFYSTT